MIFCVEISKNVIKKSRSTNLPINCCASSMFVFYKNMELARVFLQVTVTVTSTFTESNVILVKIFILRFIFKKLRIHYSPSNGKLKN